MICKNCNEPLSERAKFCGRCGTPVSPAEQEETVLLADEQAYFSQKEDENIRQIPGNGYYQTPPVQPEYAGEFQKQPQDPERKPIGKKFLLIALILAVIAGTGFGGYKIYQASQPIAAIENVVYGLIDNDWKRMYKNIDWSDEREYLSYDEFVEEIEYEMRYMDDFEWVMIRNMGFDIIQTSIGPEYYDDDLGMILRDIEVRFEIMKGAMTEDFELRVVKSSEKTFLLFPKWKLLAEDLGEIVY